MPLEMVSARLDDKTPPASRRTVDDVLVALGQVLDAERDALERFDRDALISATEEKQRLAAELKPLVDSSSLSAASSERLRSVRRQSEENQLLISYARACVVGCIDLMSGGAATYKAGSALVPSVMLNVKG